MRSVTRVLSGLALAAPVFLASCGGGSGAVATEFPVEFVEVGLVGTPRRVFDATGRETELIAVAALAVTGTARGIVPGGGQRGGKALEPPAPDQLCVDLSAQDSERLRDWTSSRLGKPVALLIGDQVLVQATLGSPLSGSSMVPIPAEARSAELRAIVDHLRLATR